MPCRLVHTCVYNSVATRFMFISMIWIRLSNMFKQESFQLGLFCYQLKNKCGCSTWIIWHFLLQKKLYWVSDPNNNKVMIYCKENDQYGQYLRNSGIKKCMLAMEKWHAFKNFNGVQHSLNRYMQNNLYNKDFSRNFGMYLFQVIKSFNIFLGWTICFDIYLKKWTVYMAVFSVLDGPDIFTNCVITFLFIS